MSTEGLETLKAESPQHVQHAEAANQSSPPQTELYSDWQSFATFEACMRLCMVKRAKSMFLENKECKEASEFLENDGALLEATFLSVHNSPRKKFVGMMKVQVVKVRMAPKVKSETAERTIQSKLSSRWKARVSSLFSTPSAVKESYVCLLRLRSSGEGSTVRMHAGSGETCTFMLDSLRDDLILQVQDSEGNYHGKVVVHATAIYEDPDKKLRWWFVYREPEHEVVGKIQLHISYLSLDGVPKAGSLYNETLAYDMVLEGAMKAQNFHQRNLLLGGKWEWLLSEFASYYGVSKAYANLRYLSHIMDVATPTADCMSLVYGLLLPVMEGHSKNTLSRLENRLLEEIEEQIERILALVFENYKSLDEQLPSGIMDIVAPAPRVAAPVLMHAVEVYALIHDISSPEAQNKLYSYFQAAAAKRSRHHLTETDEYVRRKVFMDPDVVSTACVKMQSLCLNVRNDILADVEIHNCNILPSFIDLPSLASAIYSADLLSRVGAFLAACPPTPPSSHVIDVVIATADVVKDVARWNIQ